MSAYRVEVHTGDRNWAGTDANVWIQFIGALGTSPEIRIDNKEDNFERNKLDTFTVESPQTGWIDQIRLRHDNSGSASGWYVDWVKVTDLSLGLEFTAQFNRWLAKDEDDHQIDVTKPVFVGPMTVQSGEITTCFMGYIALRDRNSAPGTDNHTFNFSSSMKQGFTVKEATKGGAKIGLSLFSKLLNAEISGEISKETTSSTETTVTYSQQDSRAIESGRSLTVIMLLYQDILSGSVSVSGVDFSWEDLRGIHADFAAYDGWLSDPEVAQRVHEIIEAQTGAGGAHSPVPLVIGHLARIPITPPRHLAAVNQSSIRAAEANLAAAQPRWIKVGLPEPVHR